MSQLAIGFIETIGLAAAIEAADVCVKSANVTLIGYEFTKGNGMAVVKVEGNVGAVKAAITAAAVSVGSMNKLYGYKVMPRPSDGIDMLIRNNNTVGYEDESAPVQEEAPVEEISGNPSVEEEPEQSTENIEETPIEEEETSEEDEEPQQEEEVESEEIVEEEPQQEEISEDSEEDVDSEEVEEEEQEEAPVEEQPKKSSKKRYTCNLCKDPECPRQKGDLRIYCIHYDEHKDN